MTIDPFEFRSFHYVSDVHSKTWTLCGHFLLLKYGELSTNVSRPNHIRILKMPHATYSKSRILLKLLTLFLEGFHDSLYSKNIVDKV